MLILHFILVVVYLLIPTSNHNADDYGIVMGMLYIFWFLHQTTTERSEQRASGWLYIFWFLHQTTTTPAIGSSLRCCISFDSYIKPQHGKVKIIFRTVVYLLIPTSNHNLSAAISKIFWLYIFWFLHQTTTCGKWFRRCYGCISFDSYIKPQLSASPSAVQQSCISFDSYIKPQLIQQR